VFYGPNTASSDSKCDGERASGHNLREMHPGGHLRRKWLKTGSSGEGRGKKEWAELDDEEEIRILPETRTPVSVPSNSGYSADPRRNLLGRPENRAFPLIQGDRHADLRLQINHFR